MNTFFEYLGLADMEKVHSQTIAWIFSDDCKALDKNQKTDLVESIFKIRAFEIKDVETEFNKIDIVLFSLDGREIVVENKLKTSEHSDQLSRYQKTFPKGEYFYLTLTAGEASNGVWINLSYDILLKGLEKMSLSNCDDAVIVKQYLRTLKNLTGIVDKFLMKPTDFKNVFRDGNKSKAVKKRLEYTEDEKYVSKNQLETTLQKLYYRKVRDTLKLKRPYIEETNGNGILGVILKENIFFKGQEFRMAFDYQLGTYKLYINSKNYYKSKKEEMPNEVYAFFENIAKEKKFGFGKYNKPTSRAYCSVSINDKIPYFPGEKGEFEEKYASYLGLAKALVKEILPEINKIESLY